MFKKTIAFMLLIAIITSSSAYAAVPYGEEYSDTPIFNFTVDFKDVDKDFWAHDYIAFCVAKGWLTGYPDGYFRPYNMISRSEFAVLLTRVTGVAPQNVVYSSYSDVKTSDWYSPFIESTKQYLTGYRLANDDLVFRPDKPITREDVAIALVKYKGYNIHFADVSIAQAMFKDFAGISFNSQKYVALAIEHGLMSGYEDQTFRAQNNITRAEAATIFWRALQYGDYNKEIDSSDKYLEPQQPVQPEQPAQPDRPVVDIPVGQTPVAPPSQEAPVANRKLEVETILMSQEQGVRDGPLGSYRIQRLSEFTVDTNTNHVYFIDDRKYIRKLDINSLSVSTIKEIDRDFTIDDRLISNNFKLEDIKFKDNKLYVIGKYSFTNAHSLFEMGLNGGQVKHLGTVDSRIRPRIFFSNSYVYVGNFQSLHRAEEDGLVLAYAPTTLGNYAGLVNFRIREKEVYCFAGGHSYGTPARLYRLNIFGGAECIYRADRGAIVAIISMTNDFLYAINSNIFKLNLEGTVELFLESNDLIYNGERKITQIDLMQLDGLGNIIFKQDNSLRKIHLN